MIKIQNTVALAVLLVGAVQSMQAAYQVGLGSNRFIGPSSADFNNLPLRSVGKPPFFCDDSGFKRIDGIDSSSDNLMFTDWAGVCIRDNKSFLYFYSEFEAVFELPFEYRQLSKKDFSQTYYGYQNCAFIIKGDECALVGPLCPCMGIFVTLVDRSETLVMHVDQSVSFITIRDTIAKFVNNVAPASIKVSIYTRWHESLSKQSEDTIAVVCSYLKNTKKINNVTTTVWKKDDVNRLKYKGGCVEDFYPPYYMATSSVFVTSTGELSSICFATEVVKLFQIKQDSGFFLDTSFFKDGAHVVDGIQNVCGDHYYDCSENYTLLGIKKLVKDFALQCNQAADDTK